MPAARKPTVPPMSDDPKRPVMPFQRRKQLEQDIAHVTEEMYRRNKELAEINRTLSLLRTIDALVLEPHTSLKMVCAHITQAITQAADYAFVGLLTRSSRTREELTLKAWSGRNWLGNKTQPELRRPLHLNIERDWFLEPSRTKMVALQGVSDKELSVLFQSSEAEMATLRAAVPLQSVYMVKLMARRRLVGLLVVGFTEQITELPPESTSLIDDLSESIGVALDNKLLFEENQHVLRQLKESNEKLKALDEAKDDFVSMASHQLRTPLTAIKGYTSMVLEGDAGEINDTQRKLLEQSFTSSQRMVYLIADLLNVSRLKTGKFVIEAAPTNLAQVVSQEIGQLTETAASRKLKLTYKMPKKFPELMIDETKTRQVIMNFIDNAIYYTPAGGHISVELTETPASVEFRVIDNGIGVPRSEKPHLFTKFYRAVNARTARPDGTGLGLFMAKKVIIAQGGAIIFESEEGKGSTFGFIFPKSSLAVKQAKA